MSEQTLEEWLKAEWEKFMTRVWERVDRYAEDRTALTRADLEHELKKFQKDVNKEAERQISFTQEWYATRYHVLEAWARKHGHDFPRKTVEQMWEETGHPHEFFAIMANGTPSARSHPTYAQQLNLMRHRAEKAEKELAKLKGEEEEP